MNADLIKAVAPWLAIFISAPLALVCVRAAMFFGSLKTTVDTLGKSMEAFTAWATEHGNRLSVVETRVEALDGRKGERRQHP